VRGSDVAVARQHGDHARAGRECRRVCAAGESC